MKRLLTVLVLSFFAAATFAQDEGKGLYSGGMLVFQPGYVYTENNHQQIEAGNLGIGGIFRFYFCDYFTTGIYGGTQKTNYNSVNSESSYINLGYGGPFLGFSHQGGKSRYTVSVFVGMGAIKNLHIENQNNNLLSEAYLYRNHTLVLSPIVSFDYSLSQRVALTLQAVCLTAKVNNDKLFYNPALQVGILFKR
ncbi:MAG: hypothetical protein PHD00_01595 [Bacteroidales bacterium]|nr:hypothetical protein [Bacteroidales bacterium]MDD4671318.1 hypothetical protein [Bacteroidales bacterium]MDY0348395.1 hypothetical protein [Tenuifilaceae bacterium]